MRPPSLLVWGLFLSAACAPAAPAGRVAPASSSAPSALDAPPVAPLHAAIRLLSSPGDRDLRVEVRFDQPMHDLLSALPASRFGVSIAPDPGGSWAWGDRYSVVFSSSKTPPRGQAFSVTAPAGIASILGGRLDQAAEATVVHGSFCLLPPGPLEGASSVWKDYTRPLVFNDELDPASVERGVELRELRQGGAVPRAISVLTQGRGLALGLAPLSSGGRFELLIKKTLRSRRGVELGKDSSLLFSIDPGPRLTIDCERAGPASPCENDQLRVSSTAPVSPAALARAMRVRGDVRLSLVEPLPPHERDLPGVVQGATEVRFKIEGKPLTRFRATVDAASLGDIWGHAVASVTPGDLIAPVSPLGAALTQGGLRVVGPPGATVSVQHAPWTSEDDWCQFWDDRRWPWASSSFVQNPGTTTRVTLDAQGQALLPLGSPRVDSLAVRVKAPRLPAFSGQLTLPAPENPLRSATLRTISDGNPPLLWALDARSRPLAGADFELRGDLARGAGVTGKTDAHGLILPAAPVPGRSFGLWLQAGPSHRIFGLSLSGRDRGVGGLLVDRSVYTAGDVVHVRGAFRAAAAGASLAGRALTLSMDGAEGTASLVTATATLDEHGFFSADLALPASLSGGQLGPYRVHASAPWLAHEHASPSFHLLEIRPPALRVEPSLDQAQYIDGDRARCSVRASEPSGEPVARGRVRFVLGGHFAYPELDRLAGLSWGPDRDTPAMVAPDGVSLDEGVAAFSFRASSGFPMLLRCRARVSEDQDETHEFASAFVHPTEFYLRFVSLERKASSLVATIEALPAMGNTFADPTLSARLLREDPSSEDRFMVEGEPCSSTGKALVCSFRAEEGRRYRVEVASVDARGHKVEATSDVVDAVHTGRRPPRAGPLAAGDLIDLDASGEARGGEALGARVTARRPVRAVIALSGGPGAAPLWHRALALAPGAHSIDVPLPATLPPELRLDLDACPDALAAPDDGVDDRCDHEERVLREVEVPRALPLTIEPSRREAMPGDEVSFSIAVGDRTPSEVTFFLVDEGILGLGSWQQPSAVGWMSHLVDNRRALRLGYRHEALEPWDTLRLGAPHNEGDRTTASAFLRRRGAVTSCYHAALATDADGKARVTCRLDGDPARFRATAVAIARDSFRTGSASTSVASWVPFSARLVLPPAARSGDRFEARGVLHNASGRPVEVAVEATSSGALQGHFSGKIALAAGERRRLSWPAVALEPGQARVTLRASGDGVSDEAEGELAVQAPAGEVIEALAPSGDAAHAITLRPGEQALADRGQLTVVAGSPEASLFADLSALVEGPDASTEQIVSRLVALVIARDRARSAGVSLPPDLDRVVGASVERLATHQQPAGWFGLWPTSGADLWVTSYALWGLRELRDRGVAVDPGVIARTTALLTRLVRSAGPEGDEMLELVGALDALTGSLAGPVETWRHLFTMRRWLPLMDRVVLLRRLAIAGMREEAATLGDEVSSEILALDERGAPARFVRKGGLMALLLRARVAQGHPQADALASALMARRGRRGSLESALVLLALDEHLRRRPGAAGALDATVQGARQTLRWDTSGAAAFTWPVALLSRGLPVGIEPPGEGQPRLWLRYARASQPAAPSDEGIALRRTFEPAIEATLARSLASRSPGADRFQRGATVIVSSAFELTGSTRDLTLTVPVPAGLEIIAQDILEACSWPMAGGRSRSTTPTPEADGTFFHTSFERCERRGDRAVFHLGELAAGLHRVSFATRAVIEGHFHAPPAVIEALFGPERGASAGGGFAVVPPP